MHHKSGEHQYQCICLLIAMFAVYHAITFAATNEMKSQSLPSRSSGISLPAQTVDTDAKGGPPSPPVAAPSPEELLTDSTHTENAANSLHTIDEDAEEEVTVRDDSSLAKKVLPPSHLVRPPVGVINHIARPNREQLPPLTEIVQSPEKASKRALRRRDTPSPGIFSKQLSTVRMYCS